MATRIGINGFGRIGRQVYRAVEQYHGDTLEVVAANDLMDTKTCAFLFKYDTNYGVYPGKVESSENTITIGEKTVKIHSQRDPADIPWADNGVDVVIESTGLFRDAKRARVHIDSGGAKRVIISAPGSGFGPDEITIVLGVNEQDYDPNKHRVMSNASCTTNCLAPVVKVLDDSFGIRQGFMTTIHAYTNDQVVLDGPHSDLRRARAAAMNIIPTTTGAARAIGEVLPHLQGKLDGLALRVPTSTVSIVDLVADLEKGASVEDVNGAFQAGAEGPLKGILEYCDEPLVSIDFKGNPASSIVDAQSTAVIGGSMVKVLSWYDNEWGYSCRTADLVAYIASKGL